jgi:hypothetical protein
MNVFGGHPKLSPPGSVQHSAVYEPQHRLPPGQFPQVRRTTSVAVTGRTA